MILPKVSIVTVTQPGREAMFLQRIYEVYFQTYRHKCEWIVVAPTETCLDLGTAVRQNFHENGVQKIIQFIPSNGTNIAEKRNIGAQLARGDIIVQVDDDDWQHPTRVERQVVALRGGKCAEVVGTNWVYAYYTETREVHRIAFWNAMGFVPGATLAYWREAWARHPFDEDSTLGEDGPFVSFYHRRGTFVDMHDPTLILLGRHGKNFSGDEQYLPASRTGKPRSPHDVIADRMKNPGRPLPLLHDESTLDAQRKHDNEVNRIYWQDVMLGDWCRFTGEAQRDLPREIS